MSHAWKYICMHLTLRAEVKNKLPGESLEKHTLFESHVVISALCYETGCLKVVATCFKLDDRAQVCDWETLRPLS